MSIKLSGTQLALLGAASQSEDLLLTTPKGARLAQARKAAAKLSWPCQGSEGEEGRPRLEAG